MSEAVVMRWQLRSRSPVEVFGLWLKVSVEKVPEVHEVLTTLSYIPNMQCQNVNTKQLDGGRVRSLWILQGSNKKQTNDRESPQLGF